jgi:hypothetical protein
VQAVGVPAHVSLAAQAPQSLGSLQPLFSSNGTHLLSHGLVPAPQTPTVQAPPSQTSVPDWGSGQPEASQDVAPQPKVGSLIATHLPAHFFDPAPQPPITHAPASHVSEAEPAAGHADMLQDVAVQP